ncbi:MAG TPA: NAD(P)-dependent oxidoreductase, partial [Opitutales bacterium]|nr:NAD(P)-dependent oxidoreductase [Opitutales bacterium]
VAEHTFGLLLALYRHIVTECNYVKSGNWKRLTGHEIAGKKLAIIGLGRIGKEVAIRGRAFGMEISAFDVYWDEAFADSHGVERKHSIAEALADADIVSLHTNLTDETRNMINAESIAKMKKGVVILNCARGELVDTAAMVDGLNSGQIGGYGADVLEVEPPPADHPLFKTPNTVLTPHIGSRTYESVVRQATMATQNLINLLKNEPAVNQANKF